ncbi:MAG: DUF3256 family protein [Prevotella sp.]|nr:DUF3256 family protein [Prevotella sp.]
MRKLFFITFMVFCLSSTAKISISDVLCTIPKDIIPSLNDEQHSELLLNRETNDSLKIKNMLDGFTSIDSIAPDFVKISVSMALDLQIRILTCNDSTQIICLVKTYTTPMLESMVSFYNTDWSTLHKNFDLPSANNPDALLASFIQRPDTMQVQTFNNLCKFIEPVVISADFSENANFYYNLTIPPTSNDKTDELKAIIKPQIFKWNGDNFTL